MTTGGVVLISAFELQENDLFIDGKGLLITSLLLTDYQEVEWGVIDVIAVSIGLSSVLIKPLHCHWVRVSIIDVLSMLRYY